MSTEREAEAVNVSPAMSTADALPAPQAGGAGTTVETPASDETTTESATVEATTDAAVAVAPAPVAIVPTAPRRAAVWVRRLLRVALTLGLLAVGVFAGWQLYLANRPAPVGVIGDPSAGVPAPAVVQELAAAIDVDDADRIRTAMNPQIFDSYASELQKYDLVSVDDVKTLGTYLDGPRSASMLVLQARRSDTSPFTLFLVVITENGQIVRLR